MARAPVGGGGRAARQLAASVSGVGAQVEQLQHYQPGALAGSVGPLFGPVVGRGELRAALEMLLPDEAVDAHPGVLVLVARLLGPADQVQRCRDLLERASTLARATVAEILRVADQLDSDTLRAQGHWKLAILASYSGDADATLHHVRQAEEHKGAWWGSGSGDFLAEAADLLDRVGHVALAREYLDRVKAEPKDAAHLVALAEAALEARHGDPRRAEELLLGLAHRRIDPREYWRATLLRGFAALRRGTDAAAGALAAQAFEGAARLGQHKLSLIRERAVTEQLLGLAASAGQPAAIALKATSLPMSITVLDRFELTIAGRPVALGSGQEAQLLKFVAVSGGRVGDGVRIDLDAFLAEAYRAQALSVSDLPMAAAIAKGTMAVHRGEVLPEDRYEDWAGRARQKVQTVMLDLLDLCGREAVCRRDLDTLRRMVERTIELAPYDDLRYLMAASALLEQGRRGEALAVVHRARTAFAELGLDPPHPLVVLERSIVA